MKVGKKILNFIFVLVIALSFTFIGVKSVVFKTIFNKEYVLEQMENNNFYSETYKLVESGFENYIGQSGLDEEVIKNICTEDKIKNDINIILSNIYEGTNEKIDTSEISNNLNSNIDKENVRTSSNSKAIDEFVEHICQSYKDTIISTSYENTINEKYSKITQKITKVQNILIIAIIISIIGVIALNVKDILKLLFWTESAVLSSAVMQLAITTVIKSKVNIDGIKIFNDAFSNIVVTIIKDILSKINIIAGKFIIVYFILVVIYAIIILSQKKEENQKELSKRLLTYGFWHSFGISYEESMIERRSNGKPYYIGNENEIFFNLSHGQELIAVACADCEVGIDAESMRKVRENAMRRTCTRKEWEWLQQSEQKELDFLRLWTLKESYMKMTGKGFSIPPEMIGFTLDEKGKIQSEKEGVFRQYLLAEGVISVCIKENAETADYFKVRKVEWES